MKQGDKPFDMSAIKSEHQQSHDEQINRGDQRLVTSSAADCPDIVSRQRVKQLDYKNRGLCIICGQQRGDGGTDVHCKHHADLAKEIRISYYTRLVDSGLCVKCRNPRGNSLSRVHCQRCSDSVAASRKKKT